jgi:hypothetical protein
MKECLWNMKQLKVKMQVDINSIGMMILSDNIKVNSHFLSVVLPPFFFFVSFLLLFSTLCLNSSMPKGFSLPSSLKSSSDRSSPKEGGSILRGP